jgi:KAP family P-loop domain
MFSRIKPDRTPLPLLRDEERADLMNARDALQRELEQKKKPDLPSFERIILYIDDLDRCPPEKVVEVLQAIHLLLCFPLFVVVVAVDARWVSRSLMVRYKELIADDRTANRGKHVTLAADERRPADAQDYLEKIFQIPYWVRRMDAKASQTFVDSLAKLFVTKDAPIPGGVKDATLAQGQPNYSGSEASPIPQEQLALKSQGHSLSPPSASSGGVSAGDSSDSRLPQTKSSAPKFIPMTLSDDEKRTLAAFAPFVGSSPRRAKRYLNLYLLLKTSMQPASAQPGKDRRINERAIITLLAIVTALGPDDEFFEILSDFHAEAGDLKSLIVSLKKEPSARSSTRSAKRDNSTAVSSRKSGEVVFKLLELNIRDSVDQGGAMVAALRRYSPTVRRYCF